MKINLRIAADGWEQMLAHVQSCIPEEACGLLAGRIEQENYQVLAVLPVENILHSPFRYRMAPEAQLQAFNQIDAQGWELLAIFHSHPQGPDYPSPTDIAEAYYPECIYLIWSKRAGEWSRQGFLIQQGQVRPVSL